MTTLSFESFLRCDATSSCICTYPRSSSSNGGLAFALGLPSAILQEGGVLPQHCHVELPRLLLPPKFVELSRHLMPGSPAPDPQMSAVNGVSLQRCQDCDQAHHRGRNPQKFRRHHKRGAQRGSGTSKAAHVRRRAPVPNSQTTCLLIAPMSANAGAQRMPELEAALQCSRRKHKAAVTRVTASRRRQLQC